MQPTESWQGDYVPLRREQCRHSALRSVLRKSQVSFVVVAITDVVIQQPSQVSPVQHNHTIQELSTYTANPALRNSVLPRTTICGPNRLPAHRLHGGDEIGTELGIPIEDCGVVGIINALNTKVKSAFFPRLPLATAAEE